METSKADALGMAKIYPKAAYFLCRYCSIQDDTAEGNRIERGGNQGDISEENLLGYCSRAVEILRDGNRMYYLWELLGLRALYLERVIEHATENQEGKPPGELTLLYQENAAWKKTLETVYDRYKVSRETFSYCYLYLEKGIFCINDVIRIRREMLGMNRRELWEGICDKKTLERLENRKLTPHRQITEELFQRLGLAGTLLRTALISESQEARRLMSRMRWYQNNHEPEKADAIFSLLESLIPTEITWNRQTLMRQEANIQNRLEEISRPAYCMRIRKALELTLPFQAFLRDGEKYLTYEEQACIQNMMRKMDRNSEEFQICMERFEEMYRLAAEGELLGNIGMAYKLVMGFVASELGNLGECDKSDWYTERMIEEDLYSRSLQSIANCLYNRWWNDTQRKKRGIPTDREWDDIDELTNCIWLSRLNKQTHQEAFYKEKRKQLTDNKKIT